MSERARVPSDLAGSILAFGIAVAVALLSLSILVTSYQLLLTQVRLPGPDNEEAERILLEIFRESIRLGVRICAVSSFVTFVGSVTISVFFVRRISSSSRIWRRG